MTVYFKKILRLLFIFINAKMEFMPPKKADVVLWGVPQSFTYILRKKLNLNKKNLSLFHIWGEKIYIVPLLISFLKFKFSLKNYSEEFINIVKPKIILSFLDNYNLFYLLKKNKFQKKILIQNATRSGENDTFVSSKFYKKNKIDYVFSQNKKIKRKYEKLLGAKVFNTGSFLSNYFPIKKNKKKYDLLFISTFKKGSEVISKSKITLNEYLEAEKNLLKNIFKFTKKHKIKLSILCTNKYYQEKEEKYYYKKVLGHNKNWQFINRNFEDYGAAYKIVDQAKIVTGIDSTLLYESFGRGNKTIFFDVRPTNRNLYKLRRFGWPNKFPKSGPFWISSSEYNKIENILKKNILINQFDWNKIYKKYSNYLMDFEQDNKSFMKIFKYCLKN